MKKSVYFLFLFAFLVGIVSAGCPSGQVCAPTKNGGYTCYIYYTGTGCGGCPCGSGSGDDGNTDCYWTGSCDRSGEWHDSCANSGGTAIWWDMSKRQTSTTYTISDCTNTPAPTCTDGIKNGNEAGVDCGGSYCVACPTCSDGILNQGEEKIDCGGPCVACPTCSDNILNQGEEKIDCGGSYCVACPTCSDGIQNQGEVDVDCEGPCSSTPCIRNVVKWFSMNGEPIDSVGIGGSVIAKILEAYAESNMTFNIIEEDGGWLGLFDKKTKIDGVGSLGWKPEEEGTYFFKVKDDSGEFLKDLDGDVVVSEDLIVNDSDDVPISISFLSPICGSNYTKGATVNIQVSVLDSDDLVSGNLTIGGDKVMDLTNGVNSKDYTFNDYGDISIVAYVENGRGERQKSVSNIMIVSSAYQQQYTAACIDEPKNFDNLDSTIVYFKAHSSAGINCSGSVCERIEHSSSSLHYSWTFSNLFDGNWDKIERNGEDPMSYSFAYPYSVSGGQWAKLSVEIV